MKTFFFDDAFAHFLLEYLPFGITFQLVFYECNLDI